MDSRENGREREWKWEREEEVERRAATVNKKTISSSDMAILLEAWL